MKICFVSTFPPSRRGLNEYGYHIAKELQQDPTLSLVILADRLPTPQPQEDSGEFNVIRCWSFNSLANPWCLLRKIRELDPDVVWFNLGFASFGNKPLPAFAGFAIPAMVRATGHYTHVTLHQLMETVDLKDAGVRFPRLYKIAGFIATRLLLMSNSISVLLPAYRRTLIEKYRAESIHFRAHGIFSARPEYPDISLRANPTQRILAFGKWGTYKRLEQMIEAFKIINEKLPNVELVIAGGNHPNMPGYVESVAERVRDNPRIRCLGYVPEEQVPELFSKASVVVMPYTSSAGSSGVAHLACQFGVPILSAEVSDFRELANAEDLAVLFYPIGNVEALSQQVIELLQDPELQREMSERNFSAALRMTMPQIIYQYLRSFHLHRRTKALQPITRFRRLPSWISSRPSLARLVAPKGAPWG
ncbi:MAG TPA: glycosyltransferase [Terriglobales bacterium]|nr:glycosyltransferase [Terriglobales bacterium]